MLVIILMAGWCLSAPAQGPAPAVESIEQCDTMIHRGITAFYHHEDYSTGLSLLEKAHSLAEKNKWHKQEFLALNNIAIIYQMGGSYGTALEYYIKAFSVATSYLKEGENKTALNNIAIVYTKTDNYPKAIEYFTKAYNIASADKDDLHKGMYALNLAESYINMNEPAKAEPYLAIAEKAIGADPYLKCISGLHRISIALSKGNNDEVIRLSKILLKEYSGRADARYNAALNSASLNQAKAYFRLQEFDLAERSTLRAIEAASSPEEKLASYDFYSQLASSTGDFRKAIQFKDSVLRLTDSIYKLRDSNLLEVSKARFEVQQTQNDLLIKETQLKNTRITLIISISSFILLLMLGGWGIRNHIQKLKLQRQTSESLRIAAEQQLQTQKTETLLEQQQLKNKIEKQNRQLAARALYLSERDRMIEDTVSALEDKSGSRIATKQISELKTHLDYDREWSEFAEIFEQTNDGLMLKIRKKHPELNSNDLRFLIYVYMNFSNKEIASMLSITQDATRKRRERISRKLGLESGSELYSYLISFINPEQIG